MIRFLSLLLCILSATCALKVMTFNLFFSASQVNDGLRKAANHILFVNPDIVALQESGNETIYKSLMEFLGNEWSGVVHCGDSKGVITRHEILGTYDHVRAGINVRIKLRDTKQEISVWSMHLQYMDYGPYVAHENHKTLEQILQGEMEVKAYFGRVHNIVELLKHPGFVQQIHNSESVPVIVAGDFNVPSHLDWTEETKSRHNGWVVEWPVTKLLSEAAGMIDSFREINPDPKAVPGFTWTVYKISDGKERKKDRLDFIFYRGSLRVKASYTYCGTAKIENDDAIWKDNEYPSDHWAVITEFEIPKKVENKPSFDIDSKYLKGQKGSPATCPMKIIH